MSLSVSFICLSVCLPVCLRDYSKTNGQIFILSFFDVDRARNYYVTKEEMQPPPSTLGV